MLGSFFISNLLKMGSIRVHFRPGFLLSAGFFGEHDFRGLFRKGAQWWLALWGNIFRGAWFSQIFRCSWGNKIHAIQQTNLTSRGNGASESHSYRVLKPHRSKLLSGKSCSYTVPKAHAEVRNILTYGLGAKPYITNYFGSWSLGYFTNFFGCNETAQ
jgi:hypothetical protein